MRILVSGSTGFLGTAAVEAFEREGHTVARLVRPETEKGNVKGPSGQSVNWDPVAGDFDEAYAEGADVLVHLAGASIAEGRWSASRKKALRASRVDATRHLISALSKLKRPPTVIVASSAIGYYGDRGDEILTEASSPGSDFLAVLCRDWEAETTRGVEFGARVVNLRCGIILGAGGGALPRMALPFKLGVGGRIGSGRQWMSWLARAEAVSIICYAMANPYLTGPVNTVSPNAVRNFEFTRLLAKTLHRPAFFPAPPFALRLALGKMADALLLASQRVLPSKLEASGYKFLYPDLAETLSRIFPR